MKTEYLRFMLEGGSGLNPEFPSEASKPKALQDTLASIK